MAWNGDDQQRWDPWGCSRNALEVVSAVSHTRDIFLFFCFKPLVRVVVFFACIIYFFKNCFLPVESD